MGSVGTTECCRPKNEIEGLCHHFKVSARKGRRKMASQAETKSGLKNISKHTPFIHIVLDSTWYHLADMKLIQNSLGYWMLIQLNIT